MQVMHPRLFVSIAAYRDRDCVNTIADLFAKARWPDRLSVGVCWQFLSPDDDDCDPLGEHRDQCRILRFDISEAEGACWARHQVQSLWRGEDYVLQIDSHMRFVEHWDEKLLAMLAACDSPRPVLSNYPAAFTPPNQIDSQVVSVLNAAGFDDDGILKLGSEGLAPADVPDVPQPTAFVGAGFIFGPSAWITDVPYDPYLYFQGEEITLAARLYTHGWDIFVPSDVLAYHDYNNRPDRPKHWTDRRDWPTLNKRSVSRVRHMLSMEESDDPE
ncbi:MAG TPA: GlcNAc-transferase family protein, partial [Magnetospirillaceae bacterium]|nr:GlcNAc-transferase family protein [Magnetospirillaceae bacterium]